MSEAATRGFAAFQIRQSRDDDHLMVLWHPYGDALGRPSPVVTETRAGDIYAMLHPLLRTPPEGASAAEEMLHALRLPDPRQQDLHIYMTVALDGLPGHQWRLAWNSLMRNLSVFTYYPGMDPDTEVDWP